MSFGSCCPSSYQPGQGTRAFGRVNHTIYKHIINLLITGQCSDMLEKGPGKLGSNATRISHCPSPFVRPWVRQDKRQLCFCRIRVNVTFHLTGLFKVF